MTSPMQTILVCGGRGYANRARVYEVLDHELASIGRDDLLILHGRCKTGADKFAEYLPASTQARLARAFSLPTHLTKS